MFAWWGRTVYRYRFIVIGVMVALCVGGGLSGMSLGSHVTQSGFYDDGSQSARASVLGDEVYGRDRTSHIVAIFTAPEGKTIDDPQWQKTITDELNTVQADHSDQILGWVGWLKAPDNPAVQSMHTSDMKRTFVSIPLKGDNDDEILNNYKTVEKYLQQLDGSKVELAGLQPVANELTGTIAKDQQRMEVLAVPLVAVVLFFVFGGVVAAGLPVIVGGLSIAGSLGILRFIAVFGPVHYFAQPVVTMIGLGIAIDYGLFVVSRFREEIAEGYDTEAAVRRTVITAGRTVVFSAVIIVASAAGLLLFPQGFLKSLTYAVIAAVLLSAILSVTVLPACLGILGRHVDALGVRTLLRVPFLRNWKPSNWWLTFLAEKTQKTKTREEVEAGFWGKLANRVMKRPLWFAVPIITVLILLIIPLGKLALGGISEKYLPPDNPVRQAQEDFDRTFPGFRTQQLTLVIKNAGPAQVNEVAGKAAQISGFTNPSWQKRPATDEGNHDPRVTVLQNGLENQGRAEEKINELRSIQPPKGVTVWVGGTPALEQDSIHSIFTHMPPMLVILLTTTTLLMFLAFGSLVLPIKAAVMSALTLGSTMGILTWIFVDGHFAGWLNFTPTPLTAPVIGLIIAIVYGLSTDYEVFLVSRMVEARERGMSTAEAIRIGTATTGRIITAAALIMAVVAGAFVFSDLVMMKYLAFGLLAALLLDATVVRMFLVPSVMKLLGDDCWWAPRWMKRLQIRLGLGEIYLPDERKRPVARSTAPALAGAAVSSAPPPPQDPAAVTRTEPRTAAKAPSDPGTTRTGAQPNRPTPTLRDREIESWLGGLRAEPQRNDRSSNPSGTGNATPVPPPKPPAHQARAMPVGEQPPGDPDEATAALPVRRSQGGESEEATEKLNARGKRDNGKEKTRQRRGGGVSAQDLLRREGRF